MVDIESAERFEPERAEEIREAVREAFVDDEKLRLADVVFERAPQKPDGEAGVIVQTARKVGPGYGLAGKYIDLPLVEALVDGGGLAAELESFREELLDELAVDEEGLTPSPEETAMEILSAHRSGRERNQLGSLIVRDGEAIGRRFEAHKANEGDEPMTVGGFLRLRGWVRYRDVEVFEEWKRKSEENDIHRFVGDKGIRYMDPVTGMHCTDREALAGQLIKDARDVGGIKAYKDLIDRHRIP